MTNTRSSIRTSLGLTILGMGLLGMLLVVLTSEAYQQFALNNQHDIFYERTKLKVDSIIHDLVTDTIQLGMAIQGTTEFKLDFQARNETSLVDHLDQGFHRAFVTLNRVQLSKIYALDKTFNIIAHSTEGLKDFSDKKLVCPQFINDSSQRQGTNRIKPVSSLCSVNGKPYIAVLIPVGGLYLQGYMLLLSDPVFNLIRAEEVLGSPILLSLPNGEKLTESPNWPKSQSDEIMFSEYHMKTGDGQPYLNFLIATRISELIQRLSKTRTIILSVGAISTLIISVLALIVLQRTAVSPLRTLSNHLRLIKQDKSNIGKHVQVHGSAEIVSLVTDFNNMSSELHALYKTLESLAFTDTLTGMDNRALFYNRLEHAIKETERYNTPFAIFMMDLNRFKNINDTLGHHIGDRVLQEVGVRLQKIVRKSDTVARLGGDEFALLLPTVDYEDGVKVVAEKIIDILSSPVIIEGHNLNISASIGIVHCPHDGTDPNLLMRRADVAMYQAKQQGEGFIYYNSSMDSHNLFDLTIEAELKKAMENGNFELYYQPKIDLKRKCITDVEALIRWFHPEHGIIPPDKFIPLAEQSGMINLVTRWVLNTALQQCAQWHQDGLKIGVAVNLSAYSLKENSLCDTVHDALDKSGLIAEYLTLELTESAIMSDASMALNILTRLDKMGVRLSVDDFGTGYSSLAYLKRLPVDEIKIDKSFVMDMIKDSNDTVIVRSTIDLAHNMGMTVVAEGVEEALIFDKLAEMNCDLGQGYYLCHPSTAADLMLWLEESPWGLARQTQPVEIA